MVKPFKENTVGVCGAKELLNESSHNAHGQVTRWDAGNKWEQPPQQQQQGPHRAQAPAGQPLPSDRTHVPGRTGHCGPRLQGNRGPQQSRTKAPAYGHNKHSTLAGQQVPCGGPVTMVTATASVTVAVHPSLPGAAYQEYTHGGFDTDCESDCFEDANARRQTHSYKRDSLEIQDLEQGQLQLSKTKGEFCNDEFCNDEILLKYIVTLLLLCVFHECLASVSNGVLVCLFFQVD